MRIKPVIKARKTWTAKEVREGAQLAETMLMEYKIFSKPGVVKLKFCGPATENFGQALQLDSEKYLVHLYKSKYWHSTIIHELKHVQQFVFGRLALGTDVMFWKGREYSVEKLTGYEIWERQAYAAERKYCRKFGYETDVST